MCAVDNGHLVAWTAQYKVERISAGGFFSGAHTDEGLICRYVPLDVFLVHKSYISCIASPALVLFTSRQGTLRPLASGSGSRSLCKVRARSTSRDLLSYTQECECLHSLSVTKLDVKITFHLLMAEVGAAMNAERIHGPAIYPVTPAGNGSSGTQAPV